MSEMTLSKQEFLDAMPPQMHRHVSDSLLASINAKLTAEPEVIENYRNNFIGFSSVMRDGKFKMEQYADAIRFVTFKAMGYTNFESYKRTFPDRYASHKAKGTSKADIEKYVSAYFKSKLVQLIFEQSLIPSYLMNADIFQDAINTQREIMMDCTISPMVRATAANSLLTHLKAPEAKKVELEIGLKDSDMLSELKRVTEAFAEKQLKDIIDGEATVADVASSNIMTVSPDDDGLYR